MTGLVIGKFYPLHNGHLQLIEFAARKSSFLNVLICCSPAETIAGHIRERWLKESLIQHPNIRVSCFYYNETDLPNTSVSSREVSAKWAAVFKKLFPSTEVFFSSEVYGDYVAEFMQIQHVPFNPGRTQTPVSASLIRQNPFAYWRFLPAAVKPYFVKKVALLGTESTGKSTLTIKLAHHFNTAFAEEKAREIVEHTETCTEEHLQQIAVAHAREIDAKAIQANKVLFCDTDINITRSYSRFLFKKELVVEPWVEEANKMDLHIFLEPECPYIQDGTRLDIEIRSKLSFSHKQILEQRKIAYITVSGNWDERFQRIVEEVNKHFFS